MYYPCSENKGADQLRGYHEADLRLCFAYAKSQFSHDAAHIMMILYNLGSGDNGADQVIIPALCLAIYPRAHAAASFTPGSNSSRQMTRASKAPQSTTDWARPGECFATALSTNAAAFL